MRNGDRASMDSMRNRAKGYKTRVSVGIIGCTGILLAACGSTANTNAKTTSAKVNLGSVTVRQARKIVAQYSAENNASNKSVSAAVQAKDETGYALEADNSMFRYEIQSGYGPAWQKTHYKPFYEHPPIDTGAKRQGLAKALRSDHGANIISNFAETDEEFL